MTDDFRQRVEAAKGKTKSVTVTDAKIQIDGKPEILLIETRLKENVPLNEQADNAVFISLEDLERRRKTVPSWTPGCRTRTCK